MAQNGMVGGVDTTLPKAMIDAAFTAIAWYNVIEINVIIFMTFKRRRGLYFWSLIVASWGIAVYALACLMKFFRVWQNDFVSVTLITIGWYAMITGQSIVQYSRLHLVVHDRHKIRWVLYMIIMNALLFHVPTTVLTYGTNSSLAETFVIPYSYMEKIQITAFSIQEFIISGLYVWKTRRILQPTLQRNRTRRVMMHLIIVNVLIIISDITLMAIEYANEYEIETTYKGALYSVKLRLEFAVLSQLMSLIRPDASSNDHGHAFTARSVALETFNQRNPNDYAKTETTIGFDGSDHRAFTGRLDEKRVMKTTEIQVEHELARPNAVLARGGIEPAKSGAVAGEAYVPGKSLSRASSQVEFAGEGYESF